MQSARAIPHRLEDTRNKELKRAELLDGGKRRLVVVAVEIGGGWSWEAVDFVRLRWCASLFRPNTRSRKAVTHIELRFTWASQLPHAPTH